MAETNNRITFGETTVEIPPLDYTHCKHAVTELDDDAKMLHCQSCGKFISGYEFIRHHLVDLAFLFKRIAEAERQLKLKYEQIEVAKKNEARIKSRIYRLNKKEKDNER